MGTLNVLEAARAVYVETFINISTDKATSPTSILGHSKRVAEKLTAWAAEQTGQRYLSVRFGTVLGSRGSMLPTFTSLIKAGGPLTITHPEVIRFFMTIREACQLVLHAGGIGNAGEVLILDMGQPVKVLDVAQRMIDMSGQDIAIVYTGLRPGEKLHEELIGARESDARPVHPKISHARVDDLAPENLDFDHWLRRCQEESADVTQILDVTASGGSLMNERIYMSSPDVGELEEQYVLAAMRSGWIAPLGPDVDAFESEMAGITFSGLRNEERLREVLKGEGVLDQHPKISHATVPPLEPDELDAARWDVEAVSK